MLTRKHFEVIAKAIATGQAAGRADTISAAHDHAIDEHVAAVHELCGMLKAENSHFDRAVFLKACNVMHFSRGSMPYAPTQEN